MSHMEGLDPKLGLQVISLRWVDRTETGDCKADIFKKSSGLLHSEKHCSRTLSAPQRAGDMP